MRCSKLSMVQPETTADTLHSDAEKLMSAVDRGLISFEEIPVLPGMPIGGIGVAPGSKGKGAFRAYIRQPPVVARLVSQGFVESGQGAPHPWHLIKGNGVVSPADKVICQSLTPEQREMIETNRVTALKRLSQLRVQQEVATLHRELSDDTMIAATDAAIAAHCAHHSA